MTPPLIPPPGGPGQSRFGGLAPQPAPAAPASGPAFAQVLDLEAARVRREQRITGAGGPGSIPASVLEEMDAARRLGDALAAQGHELRFDLTPAGVSAQLRKLDGSVVRDVPLTEAVGSDPGPTTAA